jgi:exodeoxyribonuclease VII large subunit
MPNKEEILSRLDVSGGKLALAMRNFMKNKSHQWESLTKHRALLAPRFRIEKEMQRCDVLSSKLSEKMTSSFEKKKGIFTTDLAKLGALDPMKVLLRGYSRVTDTSGKTVDSVKCVNIKDEVVISVSDGTIRSTVSKVEPKEGE